MAVLLAIESHGHWITVESNGVLKRTITIKHDGNPVCTKIDWMIGGRYDFVVEEESLAVNYCLEMNLFSRFWRYEIYRNDEPILVIGRNFKPPLENAISTP
ncbi:MAG: hypothetical protein ACFFF4_14475 [Candidatus Thorarchaeota archaeon]